MRKAMSLIFALILCADLRAPAMAIEFVDVPTNHAFREAIADCAGKGIIGGYDDGTFRPANTVVKNHFCAMLARAFYPDQLAKFDTDQYRGTYGSFGPSNVALANSNLLDNTSFRYLYGQSAVMTQGINRYDMAQIIANILKNKGFTVSDSEKTDARAQIADYSTIPDQYKDAVATVYALGIIGGYSDGTFGGDGIMNRGQAAVVIYRLAQYVGGESGTKPETPVDIDLTNVPENPTIPDQSKPETPPTPTSQTLTNGEAITESNITTILDQLKAKYPTPTDFSGGYAGLGSGRNANSNCIAKIVNQHTMPSGLRCSTTLGCGGWAAFVADELFGQTGVTWRKTTIANIRPGDMVLYFDSNNKLTHVSICTGYVSGFAPTVKIQSTDAAGKPNYKIVWGNYVTSGTNCDVYTAYPA